MKAHLVFIDESGILMAPLLRRNIHMEFFPPYAPELNPAEPLWSYLKMNPLANHAPADIHLLSRTARYHARKIRNKPDILRSFLYATPLFLRPK